jgi:hypothetical protein
VELVGQADYSLAKSATLIRVLSGSKVDPSERIAAGLHLRRLADKTGNSYDNLGDVVAPAENEGDES